MEELFAKLEKKEEAIAKLEVERKKGRTTPATDADSTASSVLMDSPAADSSAASGTQRTFCYSTSPVNGPKIDLYSQRACIAACTRVRCTTIVQ